jgi:pimeloyl-ACP methyl ester carboxylesterase
MPEIKYVDANKLRFAYLEEGKGPLVLMLHGFPDTARTWDDVRPKIAAKGYRVVTPWMRGYAPTAVPERDADLETISRDALELITALGEDSAIVVGHDWGGAAGYGATGIDPSKVKRLFVVGIPHPASVKPSPGLIWKVRHFIAYKFRGAPKRFAKNDFAALPAIYKRWSPTWSPPVEEFAAVRESFADPKSLDAAFGYYRELQFSPQSFVREPVQVSTVVFAGLDDPIVSPDAYKRGKRMFAKDYVVEEMRGGHFMHREHPDEFATKLLAHL